ncbi:MAG: DAK2 domain-containing protein [Anaerolineae bacterium]
MVDGKAQKVQEDRPLRKHETGNPIWTCDGQGLKRLLEAGTAWLETHMDAINSLNVFPVPDGDTGTNMLLTMQAALEEIANSPESSVSAIAHAAAHGALMGARGNSGVILSQILRGVARSLDKEGEFNASGLASAMKEATSTAYKGVIKPVEGTILTVVREATEAAVTAAAEEEDLRLVLEKVVNEAKESVARTPSLLPVLAEAGVVDAGGQGLFIILEGMLRYVRGETVEVDFALETAVDLHLPSEGEYGYDVQFVIQGQDLNLEEIRDTIAAMGESTLVVGDSTTVKVHIHTEEPGTPLNYGASVGSLSKITVENMQEQYQEFILSQAQPSVTLSVTSEEVCDIATVVVAQGPGLVRVFESLGASAVVPGGQTMNPSTEELLKAAEELKTDQVIILPNNANIILAAQQAQKLSGKNIRIVPTRTIPQGVSALLAFNYQADLDTNARVMERAAGEVQTVEITIATRSVQLDGVDVKKGEVIGLLDDTLAASGSSPERVIEDVLRQMKAEEYEIITIYYGENVTQGEAEALAARISQDYPEQEIELVNGGQPHYPYIISAE